MLLLLCSIINVKFFKTFSGKVAKTTFTKMGDRLETIVYAFLTLKMDNFTLCTDEACNLLSPINYANKENFKTFFSRLTFNKCQ